MQKHIITIIFLTILAFINTNVSAWVEPTDGQNIAAPINTSSQAQTKQGDLNIGGNLSTDGNLKTKGNLGVGVDNPSTKVEISQNSALKVGNAYLSSGGDSASLSNNEWYDGTKWNATGQGALLQFLGQSMGIYKHDASGNQTQLMSIDPEGNMNVKNKVNASEVSASRMCVGSDCRNSWPKEFSGWWEWHTSDYYGLYTFGSYDLMLLNPWGDISQLNADCRCKSWNYDGSFQQFTTARVVEQFGGKFFDYFSYCSEACRSCIYNGTCTGAPYFGD